MAVEVAVKSYLFKPSADEQDSESDSLGERTDEEECESKEVPEMAQPVTPESRPFRYSTLHDVESLWWIAVFSLFNNRAKGDFDRSRPSLQLRTAQAQTLFPTELHSAPRQNALKIEGTLQKLFVYLPKDLRSLSPRLEEMRIKLVRGHRKAQRKEALKLEDFSKIYRFFRKQLAILKSRSAGIHLELGLGSDQLESKKRAGTNASSSTSKKPKFGP